MVTVLMTFSSTHNFCLWERRIWKSEDLSYLGIWGIGDGAWTRAALCGAHFPAKKVDSAQGRMLSRVRLAAVSTCRTVSGYKPSRFSANCVAIASRSCATAQQPKEPKEEAKKQSNEIAAFDFEKYDNQDDYEPQNAREKVFGFACFLSLFLTCAIFL